MQEFKPVWLSQPLAGMTHAWNELPQPVSAEEALPHWQPAAALPVTAPKWRAQAARVAKRLQALLAQSHYFVLPPRRTERHFPRVVKNRAHKFPTKKMPVGVN